MKKKNLVPPDGGWGWVIVLAYALFNCLIVPVFQNFGLIFHGKFREIGLSPTDESFVVTSGLAIGMLGGLSYGPLIKRFNYRKICFVSAFLTSIGIISMMVATKVYHFLITYGFITSLGIGMGLSGYSYALNSYFLRKRSFATGFAFTITSIGSIAMPQLVSHLLTVYDVHGTILIVGGMCMNTFVSAALLQPVKWHLKEDITAPTINGDVPNENPKGSVYIIKIEENSKKDTEQNKNTENSLSAAQSTTTISSDPNLRIIEEEKSKVKMFFLSLVQFFDLELLKDKSFVNLLTGLSFGTFAEQTFSVLTPFILADLNMGIQQIATFISVLSFSDLTFRFITPFVGNYYKVSSKAMCMLSFVLLIITRSILLIPIESYGLFICIALAIGVAKGIRTVYWTLVIPDYVPLKMLPAASGFHMMLNGFFLLTGGPLLGVAKELTGTYLNCIFITNAVTMLSLTMWTSEILYKKWKHSKKKEVTKL